MAKYSILERKENISLKQEFLNRLESIRKENQEMYSPYLDEEIINLYFNNVDNFILQGLFERYNKLRESGFNRKKICNELGIDYNESFYLTGDIDEQDLKKECESLDHILDNEIFGVLNPNGKNKRRIRNLLPVFVKEHLLENTDKISYAGLENVNFRSYITLVREIQEFSVGTSLVVEAGLRNYNIMKSIKEHASIWENGEDLFGDLTLERGLSDEIFKYMYPNDFKFNVLNLDFDGQFSPSKDYTIKFLFRNKLIEPPAMLFVTLNNNEQKKQWVKQWYKNSEIEQFDLLDKTIKRYSEDNEIQLIYQEDYKDSSNMLFFTYLIK